MSSALDLASPTPVDLDAGSTAGRRVGALRHALAVAAAVTLWLIAVDCAAASIGYIVKKSGTSAGVTVTYAAGHVLGVGVLLVLWRSAGFRRRLRNASERVLPLVSTMRGVLVLIAILSALRVAWVILVTTQPTSDNAVYHGLARNILATGVYDTGNDRAYWPPGYPGFLVGLYAVFGSSLLTAKFANVVLVGLGDVLTWVVVRRYVGVRPAALALVLVAAWPGRSLHVDVISYDDLVVVLMLAAIALIPSIRPGSQSGSGRALHWALWCAAGLALGLACLVRSTVGILPALVFGWLLLRGCGPGRALARTAVMGTAMLLVMTPWAIRNYRLFDAFVPLGTNGGVNFYTSWAPGSDGGYYKPAWLELSTAAGGDELKLTPLGFRMGLDAIRADWGRAARVVAQKQVHYLGSDNWLLPVESYMAAFADKPALGQGLKLGVHTLSNGLFLLMILAPILFARRAARMFAEQPLAWLCLAVFASGAVIHTVFQAQARYHLIYLPFWSMMLATLLRPYLTPRSDT